jgi:hypothetical protein
MAAACTPAYRRPWPLTPVTQPSSSSKGAASMTCLTLPVVSRQRQAGVGPAQHQGIKQRLLNGPIYSRSIGFRPQQEEAAAAAGGLSACLAVVGNRQRQSVARRCYQVHEQRQMHVRPRVSVKASRTILPASRPVSRRSPRVGLLVQLQASLACFTALALGDTCSM